MHHNKTFFQFGIKLKSPYQIHIWLGFRDLGSHCVRAWFIHSQICLPGFASGKPSVQCELLSKILHKIGGKGVLILFELPEVWIHWEFFFLTEYFLFMNSGCLWSHPDLAHLLHLSSALWPNFERNKDVSSQGRLPSSQPERWERGLNSLSGERSFFRVP